MTTTPYPSKNHEWCKNIFIHAYMIFKDVSIIIYTCKYICIEVTIYCSITYHRISGNRCLPQSRSMRSRFFSSSSACLAADLTPSPDFCDFSTIPHALSTNDGTVSCFSCLGISTSVQYCVSNRMTSCEQR